MLTADANCRVLPSLSIKSAGNMLTADANCRVLPLFPIMRYKSRTQGVVVFLLTEAQLAEMC